MCLVLAEVRQGFKSSETGVMDDYETQQVLLTAGPTLWSLISSLRQKRALRKGLLRYPRKDYWLFVLVFGVCGCVCVLVILSSFLNLTSVRF